MMGDSYIHGFSSAPASPQISRTRPKPIPEDDQQYLADLLAEQQKLRPFIQVLPHCSRLLSQEIARCTSYSNSPAPPGLSSHRELIDQSPISHPIFSPAPSPFDINAKTPLSIDGVPPQIPSSLFSTPPSADAPFSVIQGSALHHWHHAAPTPSPASSAGTSTPGSAGPHSVSSMPPTGPPGMGPSVASGMGPTVGPTVGPPVGPAPIVKQFRRLEVPVEQYPNFNFVGRLLGPRGHSLKRVEAQTSCRILIRGRGSIKDPNREEKLRGKPGYEHLNDPLHVIVEAELPADMVDRHLARACAIINELLRPMDEPLDMLKRAQLRELAILNGSLRREQSSSHSLFAGSSSPFGDGSVHRRQTNSSS